MPLRQNSSVSIGSPDNEERPLLAEYETATRFYSWAVGELSRQRGIAPFDAYDHALRLAEDARTVCESARKALQDFQRGNNPAAKQI